jgi:NADH-quinone oxidoreductase subunit F
MPQYKIWKKVLTKKLSLDKIFNELTIANLQIRGGGKFTTCISEIDRNGKLDTYIICHAEVDEPGAFKDRDIILNQAEQIIEGIMIAGFMIGAKAGYLYLRGDLIEPLQKLEKIIQNSYAEKLLGKNLLGTGYSFDLYLVRGAGSYISGEATAMINAIEGKKSLPKVRPPSPQQSGLYGCPTLVINIETLGFISTILEKGGKWYKALSKNSVGGCKFFSVSGHISRPGSYNISLGTKFKELLNLAGGVWQNHKLKAVLPGGLTSPVLPADIIIDLALDHNSLTAAGSTLGSGGVIVMDETTCMVEVLDRITKFYRDESCGQCSPCREGTSWMHQIVNKIFLGNGTNRDLQILDKIADSINGKNICPLGDMASASVRSFMKYFRQEFVDKINIKLTVND